MTYSEIIMTLKERQEFIEANRDKFSPERLLVVTTRLNEDRASAAMAEDPIEWLKRHTA